MQVKKYGRILLSDINEFGLIQHASALAYFTFLSLIPTLAFIVYIIFLFSPLFANQEALNELIFGFVFNNFKQGVGTEIVDFIQNALTNLEPHKIGITGLAAMFYAAILLVRQIEIALNEIWDTPKNRIFYRRIIGFLVFLVSSILLLFISFTLTKKWHTSISQYSQSQFMVFMQNTCIWAFFLTIVYKIIPNCKVPFFNAFTAALSASLCIQILIKYYTYYAIYATNYQSVYGALAALPLFLIWLQLIWLIILLGAILSRRFLVGFN